MKKTYMKPEAEFVEFDNDVIRTSGGGNPVDDGSGQSVEFCSCNVLGGLTFAQ